MTASDALLALSDLVSPFSGVIAVAIGINAVLWFVEWLIDRVIGLGRV